MVSMPLAPQSGSTSSIDDVAHPAKQIESRLSTNSSSSHIRDHKKGTSSIVDVDDSVVRAEGEERTTAFVWFLVTAAATGGLLFGFDVCRRLLSQCFSSSKLTSMTSLLAQTGVIGGALVHRDVARDLGKTVLRNHQKEVSTSICARHGPHLLKPLRRLLDLDFRHYVGCSHWRLRVWFDREHKLPDLLGLSLIDIPVQADLLGRKMVIFLADVIFILGARESYK
jgi:hypothetical protein